MEDVINQVAALLRQASKTVALTGAGVSTESGIPDFRGADGLWSRYDPQEYGTMGAFSRDPQRVWQMLAELLRYCRARPNRGHYALADLEKQGLLAGIITQNIDGLHQAAGSSTVVEYHGSMRTFSCPACALPAVSLDEIQAGPLPPRCPQCRAILKPDIVFFDEAISRRALAETDSLLAGADLLLVIGTSCQVMPAGTIPGRVRSAGGLIIEINRQPVLVDGADLCLVGNFSTVMQTLLGKLAC